MRHRLRAFGLEIDAGFDVPWLPRALGASSGLRVTLARAPAAEVDAGWPADGWRPVSEERAADGVVERGISRHDVRGYRLHACGFGAARISNDGTRMLCSSEPGAGEEAWQRFLVGRVLPWAAAVRGHEVLHASSVAFGGRAVAFLGPSGAGKTSLALELVARGAGFVSDDALAVDRQTGILRVHPGPRVASVRSRAGARTAVPVEPPHGPSRLAVVCLLAEEGAGRVIPAPSVDPRLLLANTFVRALQSPDRLRRQLEVCGAIARETTILLVPRGSATVAPETAAAIKRELAEVMAV